MRTLHEEMKRGLDIRVVWCWVHSNPSSWPFSIKSHPNVAPLCEEGDVKMLEEGELNVSKSVSNGHCPRLPEGA